MASEVEEQMERAAREKADLYRQLKEQLAGDVERYRREGKERLANIISDSLNE
jgi:hypothetical protein